MKRILAWLLLLTPVWVIYVMMIYKYGLVQGSEYFWIPLLIAGALIAIMWLGIELLKSDE